VGAGGQEKKKAKEKGSQRLPLLWHASVATRGVAVDQE
jgi:hypothetical protein